MKYTETEIKGVWVIEPKCFGDARGYFMESFKRDEFEAETGIHTPFVQDNESFSERGVLRGLHFQRGDAAQAKLVRVSQGVVVDVIVDLRPGSATFGQHKMFELSAENHLQVYVPRGFAHGFVVLSDKAQFQYKVDNVYCPQAEATLKFDDPALGINWPDPGVPLNLSPKDLKGLTLEEVKKII